MKSSQPSINYHYWILIISIVFIMLFLPCCRSISHSRVDLPPSLVFLSFDDGPNAEDDTTSRLLEVLNKHQIHAMFVLLGINVECHPDLVRNIHNNGHYIINHGYSEKWSVRMRKNEFRDNLLRSEAAINAVLCDENWRKLYRPQGGFYRRSQIKILDDEGYILIPGSIRVFDATKTRNTEDRIIKRIIRKINRNDGGIILLHDARDSHHRMNVKLEENPNGAYNRSFIPDMVDKIITILLEQGYSFDYSGLRIPEIRE